MSRNNIATMIIVCVSLLFFLSCESSVGYGVVLWPEAMHTIVPGTVVKILSESRLNKTYEYYALDAKKQRLTSPTWRIAYYSSESKAKGFQNTYETYAYLVGESTRNGLPIRETNDRLSRIVYRMRDKEVCKILERGDKSDEAGFVDYWYKILTEDGQIGWVFGYYLRVYSLLDSPEKLAEKDEDPNIVLLTKNIWRPAYFREMLDNKQIILERFKNIYQMSINEADKQFKLVTPYHSAIFAYTEIRKIRFNEYITLGNSLQILFVNDSTISLTYQIENQEYSISLVIIEDSIDSIIQEEKERRNKTYQSLLQQGNLLTSNTYGDITLFPNTQLQWVGHETFTRKITDMVYSGTWDIYMDIFLSKKIADAQSYDGVFSLQDTGSNTIVIHFAYTFANNGIKLVYIPSNIIKDNIVQQIPISAVILFFSFSNS